MKLLEVLIRDREDIKYVLLATVVSLMIAGAIAPLGGHYVDLLKTNIFDLSLMALFNSSQILSNSASDSESAVPDWSAPKTPNKGIAV